MGASRTRPLLLAVLVAASLVGGLGYVLWNAHQDERSDLLRSFAHRTAFAAGTTGDILSASAKQSEAELGKMFAVPADRLPARAGTYDRWAGTPSPHLMVLDARGEVLYARTPADRQLVPPQFRGVRGPFIADLRVGPDGGALVVTATPVRTPYGRRVIVDTSPAEILQTYIDGYLKAGPAVTGSVGVLVDGTNRIVGSSTTAKTASRVRGAAFDLRHGRSFARFVGSRYVASAPVHDTTWRVVFTAPRRTLLAPVDGADRAASIALFTAFVASLLVGVLLFLRTLRRSADLAAAREREAAAEQLAFERLHDGLTRLPNRALFADRIEQALAALGRDGDGLTLIFLDLDRFKLINDSLGHSHGDELLRLVAMRLSDALRPTDTISRFGGDEFVVLAPGIHDERRAVRLAERLLGALSEPFDLSPRAVHLTASAGLVIHRADDGAITPAELLRSADVAMYRAKGRGPGSVRIFDLEMHERAVARLDTELALREALRNDELLLHYQPIVTLPDGTLRGFEALVRWERPGVGLVPPGEFIALAEESELIVDIGAWVLHRATATLADWLRSGRLDIACRLSVNVSTRQLFHAPLVATVRDALAASGLPAGNLCLEITESVMMEEPDRALAILGELKEMGVRLAIDDFGVGHSSLEQLGRMLPVDEVKLDRTFVEGMRRGSERDQAIVATVAGLARALHMTAVAEGVETPEDAAQLAELGYPLAQGFHFGRPLSVAGVEQHRLAPAAVNAA